jgi:hypothetical protein
MKRVAWINLALLLLVGALALLFFFKPSTPDNAYRLSTLAPAAVHHIQIESADAAPLQLERSGDNWLLTAPFKARADTAQVERLLAILEAQTLDRLPATDLARFDLASPHIRLTLDGQTFGYGMINELTRQQYVLTQDHVYLVGLSYATMLTTDPLRLIDKHLFAPNEAPVAFDLPDFKLVQQDGRWQLSPGATNSSQDDFNRWVDDWRTATALAMHNDAALAARKPLQTLKVKLSDGTQLSLAILQRSPELLLKRDDQPFVYQFTDEIAQRLLSPPNAVLKPPMNTDKR